MPSFDNNIVYNIKDTFETYDTGNNWNDYLEGGDLIKLDGNAISSYLVISKNPLAKNSKSYLESVSSFTIPFDASFAFSKSQNNIGQELYVSFVSTDDVDNTTIYTPVDIASITQSASVLTVNTTTPHGLSIGSRIAITNVRDTRANYPSVVVATTPTSTQFTVTAGTGGTIPSTTISTVNNSGQVVTLPTMGNIGNGTAMVSGSNSATTASYYTRSNSGYTLMSGTIAGAHNITSGSSASIQSINSPFTYAFSPTTEFRLTALHEKIQWHDVGIDSTGQSTSRQVRVQSVPNSSRPYKMVWRYVNSPSLTVPVAQIVSLTKTASATATVVTDVPHGLTTSSYVQIYGANNQTAFPNLTAAVVVSSIINETTFTVVIGSSTTATSYGGYVAQVNGQILMPGAIAQVAQSVSITNSVLNVVGNASWAGLLIGDYINLIGIRNIVDGESISLDGAYKIGNIATTTLTLIPLDVTIPETLGSTNCGGAVIKRSDVRIGIVRISKNARTKIETTPRPANDLSSALPTVVQGGTISATATASGPTAHAANISGNPIRIGARALTANYTAVATGQVADLASTTVGAVISRPYSLPEADWQAVTTVVNTTAVAIQASGGAGIKKYCTAIQYQNTNATASVFNILRGSTIIATFQAAANMTIPADITFPTPLQTAANEALNIQTVTTGTNLIVNMQGYTAP